MTYREYELDYPGYVIIKKEGYFYSAHGKSAEVVAFCTGYKLGVLGEDYITGSPITDNMEEALNGINASYIIIDEKGKIIGKNNGIDYISMYLPVHSKEDLNVIRKKSLSSDLDKINAMLAEIDGYIADLESFLPEGTVIHHISAGNGIVKQVGDGKLIADMGGAVKTYGLVIAVLNQLITSESIPDGWVDEHKELILAKDTYTKEQKRLKAELGLR